VTFSGAGGGAAAYLASRGAAGGPRAAYGRRAERLAGGTRADSGACVLRCVLYGFEFRSGGGRTSLRMGGGGGGVVERLRTSRHLTCYGLGLDQSPDCISCIDVSDVLVHRASDHAWALY
jgi:hypothetical protein